MAQIILLLFVLAGAAALGFVFAWSIQQRKQSAFQATNKALATELNDYKVAQGRLSAENETQKLSLANMENLLQNLESQLFDLEKNVRLLRDENTILAAENKRLAEKEEAVREIEVVREVPVLVFRDNKMDESTKEKAAKLVRAFKKGFSENKKKAAPPASS
jgi:regulator of replication initiation timing